jgi:hypothetical protein
MKFFLLFFFTVLMVPCDACICIEKSPLTLQICSSYDVIFFGEVQSLNSCLNGNSTVKFNVTELFKGDLPTLASVKYLCGAEDCSVDFQVGSEWLIFANKNNAQYCVFDWCSHSRELLPDSLDVYNTRLQGTTIFQDKDFLISNFEVNKKFNNQLKTRSYEKVNPKLIPVFLGVSLLFMIGGMFVFNKLSNREKKK